MRPARLLPCLVLFLPLSSKAPAQTSIPTVDATSTVARASQAFSAGKPVTSVEMTGRAEWTAGSTKDSGPVKLTANVNGENRAEFDLSEGTRVESQSALTEDRICTWSGKDGVPHNAASSNCWIATVWFLPHLALQSAMQPSLLAMSSSDGSHIRHQVVVAADAASQSKETGDVPALIQRWSKTDLILDSATSLPASLKYIIHPDASSSVDIQVEVRYSNYQNVSGVEIPMHIERYVNGSLQLSIDINSAVIS